MNYCKCLLFRQIHIAICCFHFDFCRVDYSNNEVILDIGCCLDNMIYDLEAHMHNTE